MNEIDFKNKIIIVIGAHPDDNDFICGATTAKAVQNRAKVIYLVATNGQRGSSDENITSSELGEIRKIEQKKAAEILGVSQIRFLDYDDGELKPDIGLKEKIVCFIRQHKPDFIFTMDPSHYYYKEYGFINHADHRAIGQAVLDAVYPLARDRFSFPEHHKQGLRPHKVKELFISSFLPEEANCFIDVSQTIDIKIKALISHKSQIRDEKVLEARVKNRAIDLGKKAGFNFAEAFVRLILPE